MTCTRYVNVGRMNVRLSGKLSEEVNHFKYMGSPVGVNGECERDVVDTMNEG